MKKNIYLHIGFGKTGTTAIQQFCAKQKSELLSQGFLYPKTGLVGDVHHNLAPLGAESMNKGTKKLYEKLKEEILESDAANAILSSEHFIFSKSLFIEDIKSQLSNFNVKIIFYVREQKELIESAFLQWQKVGDDYQGGLEGFFRKHKGSFNFINRITPWENCFGGQAIIARVYDRRLINADVRQDFTSLLGIGGVVSARSEIANPSLRPEFSDLVYLLDNSGINGENRSRIIKELIRLSGYFDAVKKKSLIPYDLSAEMSAYYKESNQLFSEKYLSPEHAAALCGATQTLSPHKNGAK